HTRSKRDWSSDVCSSDLQRLPPRPYSIPIAAMVLLDVGWDEVLEDCIQGMCLVRGHRCCVVRSAHYRNGRNPDFYGRDAGVRRQIGRASCRERWYVEVGE